MKILLITLLLCCTLSVQSQNYFNQSWDGETDFNAGKVIETTDGYLVFGFSFTGVQEFYARTLDIEGNEVSTNTLLTGNLYNWERGGNCIATSDGNYVVHIMELLDSGVFETVVFKINQDGEVLWTQRLVGQEDYARDLIVQVSETSDEGLLFSGSSNLLSENGEVLDHSKALAIKTDSEGEVEWITLLDEPLMTPANVDRMFFNFSHLEKPNGNFLLANTTCEKEPNTLASCIPNTRITVLSEIDASTGDLLGEQVFDNWEYHHGPLIQPIDEECFLMTQIGPSNSITIKRPWIITKVSYEGEVMWEQYYSNEDDYYYFDRSNIYAMPVVREDGSFVSIFNYRTSYLTDNGYQSHDDSMLAIFDSEGNWIDTKWLAKDTTISNGSTDTMYDLERTSDGGYIAAGTKLSNFPSQAWVVKMDSNFVQCMSDPCDSILVGVRQEVVPEKEPIAIYPNPAKDYIQVDYPIDKMGYIRLRSLDGRTKKVYSLARQIKLSEIPFGLYILEVIIESESVYREKLMIE